MVINDLEKCVEREDFGEFKLEETCLYQVLRNSKKSYYADVLKSVFDEVADALNSISRYFPNYTRHDTSHCLHVIRNYGLLLTLDGLRRLSEEELLILGLSAILHDIGMLPQSEEEVETLTKGGAEGRRVREEIRKKHHIRSARAILGLASVYWQSGSSAGASELNIGKVLDDALNRLDTSTARYVKYLTAFVSAKHRESGDKLFESIDSDRIELSEDPDLQKKLMEALPRMSGGEISWATGKARPWLLALLLALADEFDIRNTRSFIAIEDMGLESLVQAYIGYLLSNESDKQSPIHHILNQSLNKPRREETTIRIAGSLSAESSGVEIEDVLRLMQRVAEKIDNTLNVVMHGLHYKGSSIKEVLRSLPARLVINIDVTVGDKIYRLSSDMRIEADPHLFKELLSKYLYGSDVMYVLRELVSNGIDACKGRFWEFWWRSGRLPEPREYEPKLWIRLYEEGDHYVLEVGDNGSGMDEFEIRNYLLKAGASMYRDRLGEIKPISMHGIGFLSVWMVADKVVVETTPVNGELSYVVELISPSAPALITHKPRQGSEPGTKVKAYISRDKREIVNEIDRILRWVAESGLWPIGIAHTYIPKPPNHEYDSNHYVRIYVKPLGQSEEKEISKEKLTPEIIGRFDEVNEGIKLPAYLVKAAREEMPIELLLMKLMKMKLYHIAPSFRGLIMFETPIKGLRFEPEVFIDFIELPQKWSLDLKKTKITWREDKPKLYQTIARAIDAFLTGCEGRKEICGENYHVILDSELLHEWYVVGRKSYEEFFSNIIKSDLTKCNKIKILYKNLYV
ncbi:ATP-binding region, ATPase domain protein domain protein [Pyrobaculum islandicum DSM 4184]|uniref:ATP-binding region, ATPase domain protein domain protein n=1 Tax=Pyrobaculum islandicum (strain DSM 4184 / JCM 9189 / GEO3) TaxID=384616 RepID=A1RUS1_PYRIL|nr:ATP-binding protein [Pyrobaculum islandicum]ABL88703.1 ATP-binding region, ATPase domain protein domain protein [Pyrobaculum islandicum DSM 4184]